jgi:hypothetical protein
MIYAQTVCAKWSKLSRSCTICRATSPNGAHGYETAHVYMGEHPNVTIAAICGGAPWQLSRNPHSCRLAHAEPRHAVEVIDAPGVVARLAEIRYLRAAG